MPKYIIALVLLSFVGPVFAETTGLVAPDGFVLDKWQTPNGLSRFSMASATGVVLAGNSSSGGRIERLDLVTGQRQTVAGKIPREILSLTASDNEILVSFPGRISKIVSGRLVDIVYGLPIGDYLNSPVAEGPDGRIFFGQGTVTNSGVVGQDNAWLKNAPSLHDLPCKEVALSGVNVTTDNFLSAKRKDQATTGSFMPFNAQAIAGPMPGFLRCSGAVYSAASDGSGLSVYAWGLHAPQVSVSDAGEVWVFDRAMENRGSRPIASGQDSLYLAKKDSWYGWPDYQDGVHVTAASVFAADPGPVSAPLLTFPKGKYLSFMIAPDNFFLKRGIAVSDIGLDLIDVESKETTTLLTLPAGQKIMDAKFGPGGFYFLVSDPSTANSLMLYRLRRVGKGAMGGTVRRGVNAWPWAINTILLLLGLSVYFFLKRPPRTA